MLLREVATSFHTIERLSDRLLDKSTFTIGCDLGYNTPSPKYEEIGTYKIPDILIQNIKMKFNDLVYNYSFPRNLSFGIRIDEIPIIKNNIQHYPGVNLYNYIDKPLLFMDNDTKSYGTILYAIIRNNEIQTIMFAKNYLQITPEKLNVNYIISKWKTLEDRYSKRMVA